MAYLEQWAERVRHALADTPNVTEKKMFGSLGFMINGHLTIGVGDGRDGSVIMVRIGKDAETECLKEPGTTTVVMGGKPFHGWIDLAPEAVESDASLHSWVARGVSFVETLPPKHP